MAKKYDSGSSLQERVLKGVEILADNVASTLGPRGRNVILYQKGSSPVITKDGVTISKFVDLEDPFENAGAQIIKQVAARTAEECGDGTTTSTVLAQAVLREAQKYVVAGSSPVEMKRGMDKTVKEIVERIEQLSKPISSEEDIAHVASISANGDETIGKLIATAVDQAGKDGAITVEEARSVETSLELVEGFRFDSGYVSPQFINDERSGTVKYSEPYILVTDYNIETVEQMLPVLEIVARENRSFVIVCENIEGQALAAVIMNAIRGTLKIAAVKAPRYGEERRNILKDLAMSTGATFVSQESELKLKDVSLSHFGSAKKIEVAKNGTVITGGDGSLEDVEKRIESLKIELEQTDSIYDCERIQERITRLASGVAIIRVGGATEVEMIEKKHRVEDALEAVRSAQLEGIVPGGGVALIRASQNLDLKFENEDQKIGSNIVCEAVKSPIRQMAVNAGESPDLILSDVLKSETDHGWNFANGEMVNLFETGVIDPAKVTKVALQNAVSAASTLITTNYAIVQDDQ
jgi:chaperonin GroEL